MYVYVSYLATYSVLLRGASNPCGAKKAVAAAMYGAMEVWLSG